LKRFAEYTEGWKFLREQSEEYTKNMASISCILVLEDSPLYPAFAITKKTDRVFYIANIAPREADDISMPASNALIKRFADDFRRFRQAERIAISIIVTKEDVGIEEIIPSSNVRQAFECYVEINPGCRHPSDVKRLDVFICLAARYCRKPLDTFLIRRYLIEELKWTRENAEWCTDRIEAGLTILKPSSGCKAQRGKRSGWSICKRGRAIDR
jgi:hypothetical protein